MLSTYRQVGDVLNTVREFHGLLGEFYAELAKKAEDERVRVLLEQISRYERNFEAALRKFMDETADKLLKTWMQYAPELESEQVPDVNEIGGDMTVDEVVGMSMELDEELVRFYRDAADFSDYDELKELFGKLKEQEEAKKAEIMQSALSMKKDM